MVEDRPHQQGLIPIPDPTLLTTAALEREILHLRELFETRHSALNAAVWQALEEKNLRDNQRFEAQSAALDAARIAADLAVQAALVAAEKAVSKAEASAEKRYDTISEKVDDAKNTTNAAIAGIQTQLAAFAGRTAGGAALWGYIVGAIGIAAAVVGIVVKFG